MDIALVFGLEGYELGVDGRESEDGVLA